MGKPKGSIGETKLKILAILHHNEKWGIPSYGYGIWKTLRERCYSCLGSDGLRNVYHHLHDLKDKGLIINYTKQSTEGASERRLYSLTIKGVKLQRKFNGYLKALHTE